MTGADELERMADRFEGEAATIAREYPAGSFTSGCASGRNYCAQQLRARAAELRAVAPRSWSDANGTVALAEDGTIDCRRPDGSKVLDLGEGIPLVLECLTALLRERGASQ